MLNIIPIPALKDNYVWTLHNESHAIVVDPGEAKPVLAYLNAHKLRLVAILCTHHHNDHTGGIVELLQVYNAPVYGPQHEPIQCVSHSLGEGDIVEISELKVKFQVMDIPGHTRGHIAYLGMGGVFCGDTLFSCGCGRIFEGTAEQLFHALQRLANLPDETKVYCGHEYTEANIRFALDCEPDNVKLKQRQVEVRALRAVGLPTLPSTIAMEKSLNPFLRCSQSTVIATAQRQTGIRSSTEINIFTALRAWKDNY